MEKRYLEAYYQAFLIAIICSWLPLKAAGYVAPFLALVWFIIKSRSGITFLKAASFIALYAIVVAFYYALSTLYNFNYLIQNSVLALITYGGFFFLLVTPGRVVLDEEFRFKIVKVLERFILVESLFGIFQFAAAIVVRKGFAPNTGDVIQGTIYPFSFFEETDMGMGNQIFTINMALMLIFYMPYVLAYSKGYFTLLCGVISLLLALVSHVIFPLVLATCLVLLFFRKRSAGGFKVKHFILLFSFAALFSIVYNYQRELMNFYIEKFINIESPKAKVTVNSIANLPNDYPGSFIFGLGPGQFSSRAALIGTGQYIGGLSNQRSVLFFHPDMTDAFRKYILEEYLEYVSNPKYGLSTMSRPFHSALSIYAEFGFPFFTILVGYVIYLVMKLRGFFLLSEKRSSNAYRAVACAVSLLMLTFISFFENYLEVMQAIFPGVILVKIVYRSLKSKSVEPN